MNYTEYRPHMLSKVRSKAIMRSAAGKPCTLRISSFYPGHRCSGPETTVGTHLPVWGKGISTKTTDMAVAYGCQHCHDILDGVDIKRRDYLIQNFSSAVMERLLHGLTETHAIMIEEGVIIIPDSNQKLENPPMDEPTSTSALISLEAPAKPDGTKTFVELLPNGEVHHSDDVTMNEAVLLIFWNALVSKGASTIEMAHGAAKGCVYSETAKSAFAKFTDATS